MGMLRVFLRDAFPIFYYGKDNFNDPIAKATKNNTD